MKKCPKCGAEIGDDARFCLYCMTSLEQKQPIGDAKVTYRRWLYGAFALLVLILLFLCVFLRMQHKRPSMLPSGDIGTTTTASSAADNTTTQNTTDESSAQDTSQDQKHTTNAASSNTSVKSTTSTLLSSGGNNTTGRQQGGITTGRQQGGITTGHQQSGTTTGHQQNGTTTTTSPVAVSVTYTYRDARYGDDFSAGADPENCVVITGVETPAANGTYTLPETLGGKKVVAVMASAFCGDGISHTVKTVIVPSSVKTIWNYAFSECYNLTDIYFGGNAIYVESQAFAETAKRNGTLTIHCSASCHDRNLRYYKNCAASYDATYQEWNG